VTLLQDVVGGMLFEEIVGDTLSEEVDGDSMLEVWLLVILEAVVSDTFLWEAIGAPMSEWVVDNPKNSHWYVPFQRFPTQLSPILLSQYKNSYVRTHPVVLFRTAT